ncbi:hypothetical protein PYCCODRAFT_1362350 [Trametes coccinea BRFM310]|uniref:Prolyl 4-hydroxylase alpha subunit Fe(2+) 2OG dioxygenase domain-containing protein n=1 Tax=Trametes coccinea (strain BRFM310) TaxID=1353009 RepID=A0A1Y2J001_TRAC3|nr:hypothetical protein PYCCODRAFT_1362350 [Trametes coccinea BRFM310]
MPAAVKILKALRELDHLPRIGHCPTREEAQRQKMQETFPDHSDSESSEEAGQESTENTPGVQRNVKCITTLQELCESSRKYASGYLDHPFRLRITRSSCEFDAVISPTRTPPRSGGGGAEYKKLEELLKRWYDNAAVSGYGDVREQVTKIDPDIRDAREIPASEFIVEPELLRQVERTWQRHFVPGDAVRAVPYKIHLYGWGGKFEEHRDTPELGLVGTFLVGLGDTSTRGGLFLMKKPSEWSQDGERMTAHPGEWCAFYPDVPHRVECIWGGYRAVIAFKIFRAEGPARETEETRMLRQKVVEVVKEMEPTYGILLAHRYCLGTEHFSGFDAILLDAVRSLDGLVVHHLPVAMSLTSSWGSETKYSDGHDWEMYCQTNVYPFAGSYLELLEKEGHVSDKEHKRCGYPWLADEQAIPFFSVDLSQSLYEVEDREIDTCNFVGNEAQAWRQDSVYLSYALVVLKADEGGVSAVRTEST